MTEGHIALKGVRVNNLKNISLRIPRGKLVVISGLSGSGKSSLAFNTIYAEGQRRYVQSLSAYARQFLERLPKPDADRIEGLAPAIMIAQHVSTRASTSTVGTSSEIYQYLRLLFARIGHVIHPTTGERLMQHTQASIVDTIMAHAGERVVLLAPLESQLQAEMELHPSTGTRGKRRGDRTLAGALLLERLWEAGYTRIMAKGETFNLDTPEARAQLAKRNEPSLELVIDRFVPEESEEFRARCGDSVETALTEGNQHCSILILPTEGERERIDFATQIEVDGVPFPTLCPELFSFNTPLGACPRCEGYGTTRGISEELVIPDPSRSLFDDAVAPWRGAVMRQFTDYFIKMAGDRFPIHRPYYQLTQSEKALLWHGDGQILGIDSFFEDLARQQHKIQNRVMIARYSGKSLCLDCQGSRLNPFARSVQIDGMTIAQMADLPLEQLNERFASLALDAHEMGVARRLLEEIRSRLRCLCDIGLGYLTLNRAANTLSGGESQRINLATALGGPLVGSIYILDEPSVGLHPVDTHSLIDVLGRLRDIGNTVIVVEHDEDMIRSADYLVDLGPKAGSHGGEVVFAGPLKSLSEATRSFTADYLLGRRAIPLPPQRRPLNDWITLSKVFKRTLRDVAVRIPTNALTVVTGVSGSGKSTLIREVLVPELTSRLNTWDARHDFRQTVELVYPESLNDIEYIDQQALSRSLRSCALTYSKAFDSIRTIFANLPSSREANMLPVHFSFNDPSGWCPHCQGLGRFVVEMQFMADIESECEECHGARYRPEILEHTYRGKSIADVLQMTVDDAVAFFAADPHRLPQRVSRYLSVLKRVGLGYITLGQPTTTLSGGEAQRLKIATFLIDPPDNHHILFAFDEPTTGLHIHDIHVLSGMFDALIEGGHTVVVIEHNLEVIKLADWVIDMGPGGGEHGGRVVCMGRPEEVAACEESATGRFLKPKLAVTKAAE